MTIPINQRIKMIKQNPPEQLKYIRLPLEMLEKDWASNADVIVYSFMLNRYWFFKNIHREYYENMCDIAKGCKQDESTVKRAIKKLAANGYITISKIKAEIGVSNNYKVNDVHGLMKPNVEIEEPDFDF